MSRYLGCFICLSFCEEYGSESASCTLLLIIWSMYPDVELLKYKVILVLISGGTSIQLFPTTAVPLCIPTNSAQVFQFLYIFIKTYYFLGFLFVCFGGFLVIVAILMSVRRYLITTDFAFPQRLMMLSIF